MKILIICGVFAKENEQEIHEHIKRPIEYSANVFQEKLICGFQKMGCAASVISAPFIGSYPNASSTMIFTGFKKSQSKYTYVGFNNIWGIRNFSRSFSLKRAIRAFVKNPDPQKLIVVYSPHTPFLEAAVYAHKRDKNIKICMIVPDLPEYMNLDSKVSMLYKIGKRFDLRRYYKLNNHVDSYLFLTEFMAKKMNVLDRPYCIVEGIVEEGIFQQNEEKKRGLQKQNLQEKYIVYTGKMNERFGVVRLVDAFCSIENKEYRLVLCGSGDADNYIEKRAKSDSRIIHLGQRTHDEALEWILKADVLVNPRENNEEYTKFSFPSKTIEYLASGNAVVGYMLHGMPIVYDNFIFAADQEGLSSTIIKAMNADANEKEKRYLDAKRYLKTLYAPSVAEKIIHTTLKNGIKNES